MNLPDYSDLIILDEKYQEIIKLEIDLAELKDTLLIAQQNSQLQSLVDEKQVTAGLKAKITRQNIGEEIANQRMQEQAVLIQIQKEVSRVANQYGLTKNSEKENIFKFLVEKAFTKTRE